MFYRVGIKLGQNHRPAYRESVVVPPLDRADVLVGMGRIDGKWDSRVECFIDEVVICASMDLVRTGLHCVIEKSTADLPVFSREVTGLNGDLLNGIHAGLHLGRHSRDIAVTCVLPLNAE